MIGTMLSEAWHAMGANRLRSFLTMLGMMIGVAAVIMMLAIGRGAQFVVDQSIASMGSNLFIVLSGSTTSGGLRLGTGATPTLTTSDAELASRTIRSAVSRARSRLGGSADSQRRHADALATTAASGWLTSWAMAAESSATVASCVASSRRARMVRSASSRIRESISQLTSRRSRAC